jgi:phage terminase small subunit
MFVGKLSDKERRFAEEYCVDFDRERSAIAAGYSEGSARQLAWQLLQRPQVAEYIRFLKAEQTARTKINADYVLQTIIETVERCRGGVEKIEIEDGEQIKEFPYDPKSALKGLELLGKHLKIFTDVSEQKHTFTQMPTVMIGDPTPDPETGKPKMTALTFNVGSDPNGTTD